ncbi:MAG: TPM domain-containing protein [Chlorobiales bacterium]|nr:TPM domain-containing protein [Chlorobiales bacterium]
MLHVTAYSSLFAAIEVPVLSGRINDYAAMISAPAKAEIEGKLKQFEASESTQIVILTVPSLKGDPIEDFSIRVAEAWKIGQKGSDNGVLLIVSRDDHKVRIEVGYGLEGKLTDLVAGRIVRDEIVPAFKAGQFDVGFAKGVSSIIAATHGEYKAKSKAVRNGDKPSFPLLFIIFLVIYIIFHLFKGFFGGGFGGGFFGGGGNDDNFSGGGGSFGGGGSSDEW